MALVGLIEYDILTNLGWSDEAIRQMGTGLANDIVADYAVGIERGPNIEMVEPSEAASDTFVSGVGTDLTDISLSLRDGLASVGTAAQSALEIAPSIITSVAKTLEQLPLLVVGGLALYILTRKG